MTQNKPSATVPDHVSALINLKQFLEDNPFVTGVVQDLNKSLSRIDCPDTPHSYLKAELMGICLLKTI